MIIEEIPITGSMIPDKIGTNANISQILPVSAITNSAVTNYTITECNSRIFKGDGY
jgi:hypothetical protein